MNSTNFDPAFRNTEKQLTCKILAHKNSYEKPRIQYENLKNTVVIDQNQPRQNNTHRVYSSMIKQQNDKFQFQLIKLQIAKTNKIKQKMIVKRKLLSISLNFIMLIILIASLPIISAMTNSQQQAENQQKVLKILNLEETHEMHSKLQHSYSKNYEYLKNIYNSEYDFIQHSKSVLMRSNTAVQYEGKIHLENSTLNFQVEPRRNEKFIGAEIVFSSEFTGEISHSKISVSSAKQLGVYKIYKINTKLKNYSFRIEHVNRNLLNNSLEPLLIIYYKNHKSNSKLNLYESIMNNKHLRETSPESVSRVRRDVEDSTNSKAKKTHPSNRKKNRRKFLTPAEKGPCKRHRLHWSEGCCQNFWFGILHRKDFDVYKAIPCPNPSSDM